tara:strand:+ start:1203 stop:2507 length:1305 start_codon:yes stop_codon:yes gene_type:complete
MNITVIGTGYVGLVTGACLAEVGNKITCLDTSSTKIEKLQNGEMPIFEAGLEELVSRNTGEGNLGFTTEYAKACTNSIFFICVGTQDDGTGKPDLRSLYSVVQSLSDHIESNSVIFIKSTVPLSTNYKVEMQLNNLLKAKNISVKVGSNPEFLKEGVAVNDFMRPDRIIIGSTDEEVIDIARKIYKPFGWLKDKTIIMSRESAELTKYASNSFLATKISFMNEMSRIAEEIGANIHDVRKGMGSDPRIGEAFLYAGLGYGGSCFPKDINALIDLADELKVPSRILDATRNTNLSQVEFLVKKVQMHTHNLESKTAAVWGLAFKPNTDDIRESMAIKFVKELSKHCRKIKAYDPVANINAESELSNLKNVEIVDAKDKAIDGSDFLVLCTEWKEFWSPGISTLRNLKERRVFDARNIMDKDFIESEGIEYHGIGI